MKNRFKILETTLRDGSYATNFQFTANDTKIIAGKLDELGFEFIEVGHGVGLNASKKGYGVAAETDEAYLKAASEAVKNAKWGMFCIPGIARLEDIDIAAQYGMKFVRIGTNVTEVESSEKYIERAKKHGMYVSSNFMKSYALNPKLFAQKAILSQKYGADIICIVDSTGGMLTEELAKYFYEVREVCDIDIGFHGHNNLEMAVSNSMKAIELGATMIDSSLQGIGRGAGNTSTELLLMVLKRNGYEIEYDPLKVMDAGEKYIRPLLNRHGYDSIDIVSGYGQFHSSYMGVIREFAKKFSIDPRKLILAVSSKNKIDAPRNLVEDMARMISKESEKVPAEKFSMDKYYGDEQRNSDAKN